MAISIAIDGTEYLDIVQASARFSMDEIATSFRITFSDKWFSTGFADLPFQEGSLCEVFIDGEKAITGFIDDIPISYSATTHSIEVSGRSLAGLLVDCSAQHKTGSWRNSQAKSIINDLISPYGISFGFDSSVPISDQTKPLRKFAIEQEETVFDAINRIARLRGYFLISQPNGNLLGTRAGTEISQTPIQKGGNILAASRRGRFQDRYSTYLVKAQNAGDDTWFADDASTRLFYQTTDPQVVLNRPLIIVSDAQGDKKDLELRGNWERNTRAGRSRRVSYTLRGFTQNDGQLWKMNTRIRIRDPFFDIDDEFLITTVDFGFRGDGSFTELGLTLPQAYDVLIPPKKKSPKRWSLW